MTVRSGFQITRNLSATRDSEWKRAQQKMFNREIQKLVLFNDKMDPPKFNFSPYEIQDIFEDFKMKIWGIDDVHQEFDSVLREKGLEDKEKRPWLRKLDPKGCQWTVPSSEILAENMMVLEKLAGESSEGFDITT